MTSKSKTLKHQMKCAWCGQTVLMTPSTRPKQHRNGAETCVGSGQMKATHDQLIAANEAARKEKK